MKTFFQISELEHEREAAGKLYLEFLRVPSMSAGVYRLAAGSADPQKPHREDEMYYVVQGKARMRVGSDDQAIGQGSVIFVAANVEHHFHDITEELTVLVFFAPAES
ncbi:MAG: cupin domain-containing protein [Terriglobales bacterium]|jgi:mannose-6-phosphate isomerase-like protein (cupin superfamily)